MTFAGGVDQSIAERTASPAKRTESVITPPPAFGRPLRGAYTLNSLFMVYSLSVEVFAGILSDRRGQENRLVSLVHCRR